MNRSYHGIEHGCEDPDGRIITRHYPVFHWLGEGPSDPPDHPVAGRGHHLHRRIMVCDACGRAFEEARQVEIDERHEWPDGVPDLPDVRPTFSTTNAMTPDEAETYAKRGIARRDALIEVVSEHPRWTEEDQCNICPGTDPYEQHIAPFLEAQLAGKPWKKVRHGNG